MNEVWLSFKGQIFDSQCHLQEISSMEAIFKLLLHISISALGKKFLSKIGDEHSNSLVRVKRKLLDVYAVNGSVNIKSCTLGFFVSRVKHNFT